ncbi:MAG: hypothetical protein HY791_13465 [Deltaproteobacteria bacterium]|nr:hypothetical protein [Deltaproteobacteria bacterium]
MSRGHKDDDPTQLEMGPQRRSPSRIETPRAPSRLEEPRSESRAGRSESRAGRSESRAERSEPRTERAESRAGRPESRASSRSSSRPRRLSFRAGSREVEIDFRVRLLAITDNSRQDEPTTARSFRFESVEKIVVGGRTAPELVIVLDSNERIRLGTVGDRDRALRAAWALGNALRCVIEQEADDAWPGPAIAERDVEEETDKFELDDVRYDDEPTTRMAEDFVASLNQAERSAAEAALRSHSAAWQKPEDSSPALELPKREAPGAWIDALAPAPLDLSDLAVAELVTDERRRSTWIVRTKRGDRVTIPFTQAELATRQGSAIVDEPIHARPKAIPALLGLEPKIASDLEATIPPEVDVAEPEDVTYDGEDTGR